MGSLESFDEEVKEMVTTNKLSASRVKKVTDLAMDNVDQDAHLVATLFRIHKAAKSTHKISSLYIIDAIAREAKQRTKKDKGKDKESSTAVGDDVDGSSTKKGKGTYSSFLAKIEPFLDRLVGEVLSKGPPEHKDKVKKVLDIWTKTSTFSSKALKPSYAKLNGEKADDAAGLKPSRQYSSLSPSKLRHSASVMAMSSSPSTFTLTLRCGCPLARHRDRLAVG